MQLVGHKRAGADPGHGNLPWIGGTATGAHYIAAHSVPRMMDYVREAFHVAKYERRPVVLGIPYDLQKVEHMANQPYETSAVYQPKVGHMHTDPEIVAEAEVGNLS